MTVVEDDTRTEGAFQRRVDNWLQALLAGGTEKFSALIKQLPGVFPSVALESIARLEAGGLVDPAIAKSMTSQSAIPSETPPCRQTLLPLPHPMDFEWRFTSRTARQMLDLASELSDRGDHILLFGTPSVALDAMAHPMERVISFVGPNNSVMGRLVRVNEAVGAPIFTYGCEDLRRVPIAQVIILDPPWYMDFVRPMLQSATRACGKGAYIIVSLPPVGSRSKAPEDRDAVYALADRLGLEVVEESGLAVTYDTPFFEANALRALGIAPIPEWRRGDLVIFRKRGKTPSETEDTGCRPERWREIQIGTMRLFVANAGNSGGQGLIPLIHGDILTTVSRRARIRKRATLCTSGNRIFGCENTEVAVSAALSVAAELNGTSVHPQLHATVGERDEFDRVVENLREIALKEAAEERELTQGCKGKRWNFKLNSFWNGSSNPASG